MKSDSYSYDFLPDILEGEKQKASTHKSENNDLINNKELFSFNSKKERFYKMVNMPIDKIKEIENIHNKLKEFDKIKPYVMKHSSGEKIEKCIMGGAVSLMSLLIVMPSISSQYKPNDLLFPFIGYVIFLLISISMILYQDARIIYKFKKYFKNDIFNFNISEFVFVNNDDFQNPNKDLDFLLDDTHYTQKVDLDNLFKIYKNFYLNSEVK